MADGGLYAKKLILAPMVRAGRTPLRTLALEYGADLVYTEEIIDQKLLGSQRTINDILGTTDYTYEDDVVLRICNRIEKQKCVLQIGTNDAQRAANVVKKVENDVAAIDINMGCPKPFSIAGGMGAALLGSPERAKEIVQTCVSISTIPVSCKMRVLDKREDTLEFVKMLERCGVSAIGIHGRRRSERQSDMNRLNEIHEVTRVVSVPVIANGFSGSIKEYADIMRFWKQSGASSVMIARKALSNPSIFRPKGFISFEEEICGFLEMACKYDENFTSTKYVVQRILGSKQETDERGRETVLAGSVSDICKAWSISDTYQCYKNIGRRATQKRRFEVDSETGISFIDLTFPPKRLKDRSGAVTPKCILNAFCDESGIKRPVYQCKLRATDKRYEATIEVDSRKFSSRIGQPNKKMAEQVAALAALVGLGKREKLPGDWEEL
ncbi:dihydrouridine synthase domain-containing protein [Loa loa]|uniref:Dihydrouridine synthase domain-containing protein n=1 Tax=Loa loa TaxID=7209 RepID=A0A1I7VA58_LOALO|nr:dihydrouridine synthase domain-containing protein [Loa loa]EFO24657.1 dihydrouridine synthase domain-containing protein [Loa loa]